MSTNKNKLRDKILTGNILTLMFVMSIPAVISMSINAINIFIDSLFVGRYIGANALAAISLVFPLNMVSTGFSALLGAGASSLLSISIGSNNLDTQKKVFGTFFILALIVATLFTSFTYYFAPELISLMGGTGEVKELGVIYYRIILVGSFFSIFAGAANDLIRAEGKVKKAMTFGITANITNIILNPIFIIYLDLGLVGAAWATVISTLVFTSCSAWYFFTGKASYPINIKEFRLEKKLVTPIFSVGVTAMLLQVMLFVQQLVVFQSIAHYGGDKDIAFMGVCSRILFVILIPGFGFAQSMQPLIGINYGDKNYARVKKIFYTFSISYTIFSMVIWLFIMLFPLEVLTWMLPEITFIPQDIINFRMIMIATPLYPFFILTVFFFQSIGNGKSAGLILLSREIFLFIPIALLLPIYFGLTGIYATLIPVNVIMLVASLIAIKKQFKKWEKDQPKVQAKVKVKGVNLEPVLVEID